MKKAIKRSLLFILSFIQLFMFMQIPINAQGVTYYDVANEIIEKNTLHLFVPDSGMWAGIIYGELIDFDNDGSKEMMILYRDYDDESETAAVYKYINGSAELIFKEGIGSHLGQQYSDDFIEIKNENNKVYLIVNHFDDFSFYEDKDVEQISVFTMNDGKANVTEYYGEVEPWWNDNGDYPDEFIYTYCQKNGVEINTNQYLEEIRTYINNSKSIMMVDEGFADDEVNRIYYTSMSKTLDFLDTLKNEKPLDEHSTVSNNQFPTLDTVCNLYYNVICNNNSMFSEYSIYDIDKDGIPELLLKTGDCEANYEYDVYTINHNSLKFVGIFNGFHTCLFSYPGSGILREVGHMGYERVSLVNYIYGQFFEELKYEADDSYDPDTCDYYYSTNMDKYFEGAKPIKHIFEDKSYGTLYSEVEKYLAQETGIKVSLKGNELAFDQNPVLLNSRTMVPLRVIFESLGASVEWNQDEKSVTSKKDGTTIKIKVNSNKMSVNDKTIELDAAPIIINGRTLVPVRAISESFGCNVEWNGETRSVKIIMNIAEAPTNPYNQMGYVNITGKTLGDIAKENNMELSALLEEYNLPKDMAGDTEESVAYYCMPVKRVAQMYEMSFAEMKELLDFGDDITEDTPWGYAEGETTIGIYVGIDMFEDFKKEYGLGDDITISTKWKEVRNIVDLEAKRRFQEDQYIKESRPYTQKTLK